MKKLSLLTLPVMLAGLSGQADFLSAQEQGGIEQEIFGEAIQVNVVNVEVYVSDKQGRPVPDLTLDDFEIFEDGQQMEITNFAGVVGGERLLPAVGGAGLEPAQERPTARLPLPVIEPEPPREDQRLRLVVYVDNVNIRPLERKRVMDELRSFLHTKLGREDQAMLVSYDRSFKLRQPFTSDFDLISRALEEIDAVRGEGGAFDAERRRLIRRIDRSENAGQALLAIRPYADSVYDSLNRSVDALRDLVEFLAGLPGRKAVLYVSSGIPMVAALDLLSAVEQKFASQSAMSDIMSYDASRRFEELGSVANANGITFYTLDAGGLRPDMAGAAENPGVGDDRLATHLYRDHYANLQDPLFFMADETGGRAILNRNEVLPALDEIASDFDSYYSLGYSPDHFGTGRLYNLKVQVKRKGVRVRHRKSYRDKSSRTLMHESTRAALLHAVDSNPWGLDLVFGRAVEREKDRFVVPMQVRIPVGKLVLFPRGTYHEARVRLFIAAMDEKGGLSAVEEAPLGIRIPSDKVDAALGEKWLYTHRLLMRQGRHSVAVGVQDELAAESAVTIRSLVVGG
jgi:VWFA-related protein